MTDKTPPQKAPAKDLEASTTNAPSDPSPSPLKLTRVVRPGLPPMLWHNMDEEKGANDTGEKDKKAEDKSEKITSEKTTADPNALAINKKPSDLGLEEKTLPQPPSPPAQTPKSRQKPKQSTLTTAKQPAQKANETGKNKDPDTGDASVAGAKATEATPLDDLHLSAKPEAPATASVNTATTPVTPHPDLTQLKEEMHRHLEREIKESMHVLERHLLDRMRREIDRSFERFQSNTNHEKPQKSEKS